MKKLLAPILIFMTYCSFGQEKINYKKEMIDSGEKQLSQPQQMSTSQNDFIEYKKARAWQSRMTTIFSDPADLDIEGIGGRVRASLVDATNNISLVAPSGGGLWKFNATDGSSFTPIDDLGSFLAITDIAQDPNNSQHIIIATGDEQHRSTGNGLFESLDGGDTFSQIASTSPAIVSDFDYVRFVKFSPITANTLYLSAGKKLFRSIDSGSSWTEVLDTGSNNFSIRSLDFTANTGVIVSVNRKGLYTSTTGDLGSFSVLTNGVPNDDAGTNSIVEYVVTATHAANRNIAYAFFATSTTKNMYKTIDGGASWVQGSDPTFSATQPWFCLTIGVHPTNPNTVVAGGVGWGYTTDGGTTWSSGAGLEVDFHSVHFHASNPDVAYLGYDQGIGRVDFGNYADLVEWQFDGTNWVPVTVSQPTQLELGKQGGFNTTQIYFGDYYPEAYGDAYLEGQQDGGCFAKFGAIQTRILVGDGGSVFVNKQDPTKVFASTQYGNLKQSPNGLVPNYNDFTAVSSFPGSYPNFITQFAGNNADGNQLYIPNSTDVYRTTDNGATFNSIATHALGSPSIAVENAIDPTVYLIGYDSGNSYNSDIIRIENATTSATTTTHGDVLIGYTEGAYTDRINVDPNDKNTIYVTTTTGNAFKYTGMNTGTPTRTSVKGDIPGVIFNTVIGIKNASDLLIAGTNIGLFYSINGGTNWVLSDEIPYTQVTDLKMRDSDSRLFVFTYGRGAWATTITYSTLGVIEKEQTNVTIFPNPTNGVIQVTSLENMDLDIVLYDINGKKVVVTNNKKKIDVSHLSAGVYMLHAISNNTTVAIKKIIVK